VDGTYVRIAADLAAVLDDGDRMRVLAILSKGSLQNISDIMFLRGVDVGIVQSDALPYARRERLYPNVATMVQYIAKLYDEEVHLLAGRGIERIEDLAGKPVNLDVRGSGTSMTASLLFGSLGIEIQPQHDPQDTALEKLKRGEIAAMVYVAGKPARLFLGAPADAGLHFLPIPLSDALVEAYLPATLAAADYPALVPAGTTVETVAVGAVLAVYAWPQGSERYRKMQRFVESLHAKFDRLRVPPRHPKWRDVSLAARVPGWTRFAAAEPAATPRR
jgi:TRAP-type uncharacterized transport system substrate-binding protein